MTQLPTKRYTQALFELCQDKNKTDAVHQDLKGIHKLIEKSKEFARFLENPVLPSAQRQTIIKKIFKGKIHSITYSYLLFLVEKNRLQILTAICEQFEQLYMEDKGIIRVKVTSRNKLNANQVNSLCSHLKTKLGKDIEPQLEVNPNMIGGIKIQIGDYIYDYSLRTQLEKFRETLIHA